MKARQRDVRLFLSANSFAVFRRSTSVWRHFPHNMAVALLCIPRLENVQYPYHLYISPSNRPGIKGPARPFQCPTCGVRFTRIQNLKQHMLIHSGEQFNADVLQLQRPSFTVSSSVLSSSPCLALHLCVICICVYLHICLSDSLRSLCDLAITVPHILKHVILPWSPF